jgi:hypothetical protein
MPGRDLDDHAMAGMVGQRLHERGKVGNVVQDVVA